MGKTHANVMLLLLRKPYFPFKSQNATQLLPLGSAVTDQSCKSRRWRGQDGQGGRRGEAPAGPEGGQSPAEGVQAEVRGSPWASCPHASFPGCLPLPGAALGFGARLDLYVSSAHRKVCEKSPLSKCVGALGSFRAAGNIPALSLRHW